VAGCGDAGNMGVVSGTVKLDGQPVPSGTITFVPVDGMTTTAGGPIRDGHYSVKVPIAVMRVSISVPKVTGSKKLYDTPDSPEMPLTAEALPARYNEQTELKIEVKAGSNPMDFDLTSE
jgi:hypothetical protein